MALPTFTKQELARIAQCVRRCKGDTIYRPEHEELEALALKIDRTRDMLRFAEIGEELREEQFAGGRDAI